MYNRVRAYRTGTACRFLGVRRSTKCEVCGTEAAGLPEPLKTAIQAAAEAHAVSVAAMARGRGGATVVAGPPGFAFMQVVVPRHFSASASRWWAHSTGLQLLATYFLACLLPAIVAVVTITTWLVAGPLNTNFGVAVAMACIASALTMVHW